MTGDYGAAYPSMAYFIFQTVFCATAATIVSVALVGALPGCDTENLIFP